LGAAADWAQPLIGRGRVGFTIHCCRPWRRQVEYTLLAGPTDKAARYSMGVRGMLGYGRMKASFVGYVDGRSPGRAVPDIGESD
jgi:hypothetical protein